MIYFNFLKLSLLIILLISKIGFTRIEFPNISKPLNLASGEFLEGTIIKLSKEEIEKFLPFAYEVRGLLTKALSMANKKSLEEKVLFLENEISHVVRLIANKRYQMFMKFALNRGLFLSKMINAESDMSTPGIIENRLSILRVSIDTALKYYTADKEFQENISTSDVKFGLPYAQFGIDLARGFIDFSKDIFDASAQYKVMYKIFEMLNWDLSRDRDKYNYAHQVITIWKVINSEVILSQDEHDINFISKIRRLYLLLDKVSNKLQLVIATQKISKKSKYSIAKSITKNLDGSWTIIEPRLTNEKIHYLISSSGESVCRLFGYDNSLVDMEIFGLKNARRAVQLGVADNPFIRIKKNQKPILEVTCFNKGGHKTVKIAESIIHNRGKVTINKPMLIRGNREFPIIWHSEGVCKLFGFESYPREVEKSSHGIDRSVILKDDGTFDDFVHNQQIIQKLECSNY